VIDHYAAQATPIQRILTDNGSSYRSHAFRDLLTKHGIRHIRTRPYTPRTNGKAEAFIRILQREWAYGHVYPTSNHRARALPGWTRWYNNHRPHGGIGGQPPLSRVSHAARSYS
jgi:transposase InsO family protein